ncbi:MULTISPECIES: hypothetical protein [Leeuwenhoekiella]|uniref:hypothetical protein n=1 Tax=Leeuwenhoekiella TaxID=283735 RepID=UPI000C45BE23|nr:MULTISPECIES: hypothetical protein [Leeuwenhoekiella]MAO42214.1 hypothetical protein [Leeuwenhoekiella sp.]MBQ51381.1 hypothetical protein [Leeuwenhoekiella sp.]
MEKASDTNKRNVSNSFHNAWTIIDYANRINDLLYQLPWENKKEILGNLYNLKDFRNTFQHLGVRNTAVLKKNTPFFGIISWFYFNNKTEKHKLHYFISGVARITEMDRIVPDTTQFDKKINNIALHTVNGKKVIKAELNNVIKDLKNLCLNLEERIQNYYERHQLEKSNWEKRRDIHIILKPEDYEE